MRESFPIAGGGPAGAAAALAMTQAGLRPLLYEKSPFPRHKVCGEFLSPEIVPMLEQLALASQFLALGPARVTHAELHFSRACRRFRLPEPAYGLSRYAFDDLLLRSAIERGTELRREAVEESSGAGVCARGRKPVSRRGARIFGFKAHFSGPPNDAVELYFFPGGYCGLAPIEGGGTNLCGLVTEDLLQPRRFLMEAVFETIPRLKERVKALERSTRWHFTGPLQMGPPATASGDWLPAGDAACFLDPFTGSGILAAVQTGAWAGAAAIRAAQGESWPRCRDWHRRLCRSFYRRQLSAAGILRRLLDLGISDWFASLLPGPLLFRLTRPS